MNDLPEYIENYAALYYCVREETTINQAIGRCLDYKKHAKRRKRYLREKERYSGRA
jgi:hypothetical protein